LDKCELPKQKQPAPKKSRKEARDGGGNTHRARIRTGEKKEGGGRDPDIRCWLEKTVPQNN